MSARRTSLSDRKAFDWIFDICSDPCVTIENGLIVRINPAWTRMTAWTADETVGRRFSDLLHPDDLDAMAAIEAGLVATGAGAGELRAMTSSGEWRQVRARSTSQRDGHVILTLQELRKPGEGVNSEDDARKPYELLRQGVGIFVYCYDPERRIYTFDPDLNRPRETQQSARSTMAGSVITRQIHADDTASVTVAWAAVIATGKRQIIEYRQFRPDGSVYRVRSTWCGLRRLPSGRWEVFGVTQDVTELADARDVALQGQEAARAAAEAQAQFLANMSHEIRTPMNGVLGVLHLLKKESLSAGGRGLLKEALACGSMLSGLLNDVLDFSKIEAGQLSLFAEPVNVLEAVEGVVAMLRSQAEGKRLFLRTVVLEDPGWVLSDPVRLRQMLFNLIGNAIKFTLEGGVEVRVKAFNGESGRRLRVEVVDTGIGIPAEVQTSLFQRFKQADGSTTRRFGGSGLGLAISRRIAELMGGEVGLTSREGCGSTFWFEIDAAATEAAVELDAIEASFLNGLRILLVEDNATNRMIATQMLEQLGAVVDVAENGAIGVEAVQRTSYDLIFMDIQMPILDGIAATRAIRGLGGAIAQAESYREVGMNGAVAKPISPAAMLAEIARVLAELDSAPQECLASERPPLATRNA
jgi:two-component system, sensor histidine kinase